MHSPLRSAWRILRDESGQTLLMFTLLLPIIFGFGALAIDVGVFRYQQEQLQSAADAAAIAGALEISYCGGTSNCAVMQAAALQSMSENGYSNVTLNTQCTGTNSATGITLTLNNGPCELGSISNDPHYGNAAYVEAVVSQEEPTYLGRIFGIHHFLISARAEANPGSSPYCIYVSTQNPNASGGQAITINGNASLTASCGLMDDSGASPALIVNGNSKLETTRNDVHGTALLNGNYKVTPKINQNAPTLPDPFGYLKPPSSSGCTYNNMTLDGNTTTTLSSGTYCGGLQINGNSNVTLSPGIYYMTGNFIENGNDTLSGNGVTLYFSAGGLTLNGNSHADLVAPTTGDYAGILLYQNPSDSTSVIINGNSTSVFQGTLYAPGAQMTINGNGNLAAYTILDAASIMDNGNAAFHLGNDYSSLPGGDPAKGVTAVLSE